MDQALDQGLDRLWFAQPLEDRFLADQADSRLLLVTDQKGVREHLPASN